MQDCSIAIVKVVLRVKQNTCWITSQYHNINCHTSIFFLNHVVNYWRQHKYCLNCATGERHILPPAGPLRPWFRFPAPAGDVIQRRLVRARAVSPSTRSAGALLISDGFVAPRKYCRWPWQPKLSAQVIVVCDGSPRTAGAFIRFCCIRRNGLIYMWLSQDSCVTGLW